MPHPDTPTIAVTARSRSRFARLRVRRLRTTPALAIKLLIGTAELPASKTRPADRPGRIPQGTARPSGHEPR